MTNKEFYGDKLFAALIGVSSCQLMHYYVFGENCTGNNCKDCRFSSMENIENWLNAEYVEPESPLLKNGDSLNPGDWIMVRDGDGVSWRKRQFMCYFNNHFYCFKPHSQFKNECDCVMWAQARLPEEGE